MSGDIKWNSSSLIDIQTWFEYLKRINSNDHDDDDEDLVIDDQSDILNSTITKEEIVESVNGLKTNEASG